MIYLLRHGEVEISGNERLFIGQSDLPLSETGKNQAQEWAQVLARISFEQIYTSDLFRALETAKIIAGGVSAPIIPLKELREIDLGEWDGRPMAEIRKHHPKDWERRGEFPATFRPPGGESFTDLYCRVMPVFENIACNGRFNQLIVSHAGVNRMMICHVLGSPVDYLFRIEQDYAALNIIDDREHPMRIRAINLQLTLSSNLCSRQCIGEVS